MLRFAVDLGLPVAVRYPRGEAYDGLKEFREPIEYGRSEVLYAESGIVLFAVGSMVKTAVKVREELKGKGYACSIVNARFVKPIDEEAVCVAAENHKLLVTMEENVLSGGYGERVRDFVDRNKIQIKVVNVALPDEYVEHGNVDILKREVGIDKDSITEKILTEMQSERKIRRPFGKAWIK